MEARHAERLTPPCLPQIPLDIIAFKLKCLCASCACSSRRAKRPCHIFVSGSVSGRWPLRTGLVIVRIPSDLIVLAPY